MCDYSLESVASRPAVAADRLVTTRFPTTLTRGFAGVGNLNTAVCLRPGTELVFDVAPRYDHTWAPWPKTAPGTVARFRQIDLDACHAHHDALEFADGTVVLLARLCPGQHATILQLPNIAGNQSTASTEAKLSEHVAH
jgi:hypothetical protein